jgi:hypothetical protein
LGAAPAPLLAEHSALQRRQVVLTTPPFTV